MPGAIFNTGRKRRLLDSPDSLTPRQRARITYAAKASIRSAVADMRAILESDNEALGSFLLGELASLPGTGRMPGDPEAGDTVVDDGEEFWTGAVEL